MADVVIIGGGVIGCAVAAFLAEAGASVRLHEREVLGAGASGRNSGVFEHPLDTALEPLYARSLEHYAALDGFPLPAEPVGCLVLGEDPAPLRAQAAALAPRFPTVAFDDLDDADLARAEPGLAPGLHAFRMETGRPVPPAAAVRAYAARARAAGAELLEGSAARLARDGDRVTGVETAGGFEPAGAVVVAAGPWSGELGLPLPVTALWGVVAQVRLAAPPRHVLEEAGAESLVAAEPPETRLFSLITLDGTSSLGSSFDAGEPAPEAVAVELRERGARFVPALADAALGPLRRCARPLSADGRPLLGPVPGIAGLHVATGHGPWGVTLGPASAELVAAAVLDPQGALAPELDVSRVL
ncbi:MAG: D-hydroxyproline dehydrogenase subunit beta [Solirubrobacteraceae bacterium]|jgi:glycine/D-amino acid oxidase-like deaminating enzyme|nr:D-hydroxyproline dehydrogenase subunit beta [Solirubrobacteraceae bacterium]